jgi:hypothetical protein
LLLVAVAATGTLVAGVLSGSSRGVTAPIAVYPTQGTAVASPTTQISFRGAAPADLGQIAVAGSKTGSHSGTLKAHSDGNGASFLLSKPFSPGETVTIRAGAPLVGAQNGAVTFAIARPFTHGKPMLLPDPGGHPRNEQHFHSRPDLLPPTLRVLNRTSAASQDAIFVGPKAGPGVNGVAIYDGNGSLVWFRPSPSHVSAFDFRVQRYEGRPVLTWWQGRAIFPGEGLGAGMIYDTSYRPVAVVRAGNGYVADLHEFELTPQGTALVLAYRPVLWNLSRAHGSRQGVALDNVVQEIDVKTGLVEREWHSLGHVGVETSAVKPVKNVPFDAFHANAIEPETNGSWLVSSRNTNGAYEIDPTTGKVLWVLGGKRSTFKMLAGAQFLGQHDVRRAPDGNITLFDNGTFGIKTGRASRALELALDMNARTARVVHGFVHQRPTERTFSQGSMRTLSNGNLFVGWGGANPYITEFSPTGSVVFDGLFEPHGDDTYRAFRFPWTGIVPAGPPDVAASTAGGKTTVWASWNGATVVAGWRVLAGQQSGSLSPVGQAQRSGFETAISLSGTQRFVQVQALDSAGGVLGTSAVKQPKA